MAKLSFSVEKTFCEECSLAVRRFVGHMKGVESVDIEEEGIAVVFDEEKISGSEIARITADSIQRLGYRIEKKEGEGE